ncbi:MAG: insulinase family protein [Spirochaetales bacterium]|nr:insulinase family protein [Spirochaetales bacterium]
MNTLVAGDSLFGFTVRSVMEIPDHQSCLITLDHVKTGCEFIHFLNTDREKLFSFIFRTPPDDDTGIPHIIEHAVLCGSRAFPVKDPFVLLLKGSMKTFLNAFTAPDCTMYVGSSTLDQDFLNLMHVYGDAVFNPLLKEEVFMQEGYHLEFDEKNPGRLSIVGVVYNEMKGNYSDPESIVYEYSCRALFPNTTYRYEAGGDPEHIPDLTFRKLLRYYRKYYHPSNCKIFVYGDISTADICEFVHGRFLSPYGPRSIKSSIMCQKRWKRPRNIEKTFALAPHLETKARSIITINWLIGPVTDSLLLLSFRILAEILVGNAGSPLRKVLVDSGLGEDISPATGLETGFKEMVFSIGLRGTDESKKETMLSLVTRTLEKLASDGWDDELLRAAVQRIVFRNREISSSGGPYGLRQMMRVLKGWLYDANTADSFFFDERMDEFRERLAREKDYLQHLLRTYLIDNNHRTLLIVKPDHAQKRREETKIRKRLSNIESNETELGKIRTAMEKLRKYQETPDSPFDIKKIPSLSLRDMPKSPPAIPIEKRLVHNSVPLYFHDIGTNGIVYVDVAFDMSGIDCELIPAMTMFRKAVSGAGLPGIGYEVVARKLSLYTGGFFGTFSTNTDVVSGEHRAYTIFRVMALEENVKEALSLMTDLLLHADFTDTRRISDMVFELRNNYRSSLIPSGNFYASLRAGSRLSPSLSLEEKVRGIEQILYLKELSRGLDEKIETVKMQLSRVRDELVNRHRLALNLTCEKKYLDVVEKEMERMVGMIPAGRPPAEDRTVYRKPAFDDEVEAIATTTNVGYIARAFMGAPYTNKENALQAVLSHLLNTGYLWEEVRMKGGAYGASAQLFGTDGIFIFSSYRDPNITKTLRAFRDSLLAVRGKTLSSDQIEKAVIGTISKSEKPYTPAKLGYISFKRLLYGISDEIRQKRRDIILSTDHHSLASVSDRLLDAYDKGVSVVIADRQSILGESSQMQSLLSGLWEIET